LTVELPDALTDGRPGEQPTVELTVLLPCLNEAETLASCVLAAQAYLARSGVSGEVLVADNGSTDGSPGIAAELGARVVRVPVRGYGAALRAGIAAARGRYVIMADADDSYDLSALDPFLGRLRAGDDLVMGNRFRGGIAPGAMPALHRYLGNPVLSFVGRLFFRSPVDDFHCGIRGFRRDRVTELDLRTSGMEFASEMVVKATLHGLRISEVPTTLRPDGRSRPPHLRSWRDGWRHLRFLLIYSPRWLYLYPGLLAMVLGLAGLIWLEPAPRYVGSVGFDVETLVYCAGALIIGYQAVLFSLLSKVFGVAEGLLPASPRVRRLVRRISLEAGLVVGGLLVAGGIAVAAIGLVNWGDVRFGPLDPDRTVRYALPAMTAILLGVETLLASFFLSLLGMGRAGREVAEGAGGAEEEPAAGYRAAGWDSRSSTGRDARRGPESSDCQASAPAGGISGSTGSR
jgi:glycosyltransferase involved in cell wall biosynthesis